MKHILLLTFLLLAPPAALHAADAPIPSLTQALEQAHSELWRRFVDPHGIIRDYVGELPTPEDCALGKPNAIGWWSPIENGPMFTGLYLPAACERARRSCDSFDKDQARRLAQGLLKCASVSDVPGFIARGIGTDGVCHYPLSSDDQTHPWFLGLHAYFKSDLPSPEERQKIAAKIKEVADALEATHWQVPCEGAFKGDFRGGFQGHLFRDAARYLFMLRATYEITGDHTWLDRYHKACAERPGHADKTRVQICAEGYPFDREAIPHIDESQLWIYVGSQASLAKLIAMETDESLRASYRAGLDVNARNALSAIKAHASFDNNDTKVFGNANWRALYPTWFPQPTQADAKKLSEISDNSKRGERKHYESRFMKNPLAGAAIVALLGDGTEREAIEQAIRQYDYSKLNMAEFFFAECAFYALPVSPQAAEVAKPKPINPNAWVKAETDHADAIYRCGEKVVFRVSLADKAPSLPAELAWSLTLDGAKVLQQGTVTLKDGSATVEGTLDQPGVLQFKVTPTANAEALGIGMAGAAFEPYHITPTAKIPSDFEVFWNAQKAELAKVPLDAKIEPVAQDNAAIELFEVSFANINGLRSHGYLAKPKGVNSLPIMISQPGMGVHPNGLKESRWVIGNAALGFLALDMSAHDMPMERTPEDEARWKKFVGYPYIGSDDRMTYYYRQVFTGMVRGIDYLTSRPDWNHKAIISSGGSQGGGLAIIAAALDPRITAVVSIAPALGEHTGPLHGRPDAAPSNLIMGRDKKTPDPKIIVATAYYDTVNFARFVKVPVLMSSGLIDTACPPTTVLSIYNTLTCPKQLDLAPLVGHNQGPRFNELRNRFLMKHAGIADPTGKATAPTNLGAPIEKK